MNGELVSTVCNRVPPKEWNISREDDCHSKIFPYNRGKTGRGLIV